MSTIIGILLGVIAVGLGMVMKGASLGALFNPAAILIIFVGTGASLAVAFPGNELKRFPILLKMVLTPKKRISKEEIVRFFADVSVLVRREGLLALEPEIEKADHPFLKLGLGLILDGSDQELTRDILAQEIEAMQLRHRANAALFSQAGTYAPTLGVLGAVVGLISAMGNMTDMDVLGASISAAFMATLFGIFSGYVLWHPIANKLKRLSQQEAELKVMMTEGILGLAEVQNPRILEAKLLIFLSMEEREKYNNSSTQERSVMNEKEINA
ncbi:flagellar motor protein MotA [Ammoniphilus oxalaticus]|uniref:Flagellar motor protein MotA n=1 Tax=Ammoniphilus oxalaticus TaxID=66863 RepID=A0A419SJJ6_9BACL|nr:flagellar motor stator protein MotA [Ammoniphilus oxalaticus]RKD24214.1 flagellar motor protein MotA [Ammoniphilus oxalaticus]